MGLPDGDGDGTAFVVVAFHLLHLFSQTDEVAAKHLLSLSGQTWSTFANNVDESRVDWVLGNQLTPCSMRYTASSCRDQFRRQFHPHLVCSCGCS